MATPDVISPVDITQHAAIAPSVVLDRKPGQHNVRTVMNYYKDPEDGSPPAPFYIEYGPFPSYESNAFAFVSLC